MKRHVAMLLRGVLRAPKCSVPLAFGVAAFWCLALLARGNRGTFALSGAAVSLLLPLLAATAAKSATPRASGDSHAASEFWVDAGLSPSRALCTQFVGCASVLTFALGGALLPFLLLAHTPGDAPLAGDVLVTLPIVPFAAIAYAGYYMVSGTFWRGRATTFALLLEILLLSPDASGWPVPSSHTMALLGATTGNAIGSLARYAFLLAFGAVGLALTWLRVRQRAATFVGAEGRVLP